MTRRQIAHRVLILTVVTAGFWAYLIWLVRT